MTLVMPGEGYKHEDEAHVGASLAERVAAGDRDAEAAIVTRYRDGLVIMLRRRLGDADQAEDLAHDALMTVITKLRTDRLEQPERLAGYIHGIAKNLAIADDRKATRRRTDTNQEVIANTSDDGASEPSRDVARNELRAIVRQLLDELRVPRDREVLIRYYVLEQDRSTIYRDLEIDATHLNRVLFRAKERFKVLVERANARSKMHLVE